MNNVEDFLENKERLEELMSMALNCAKDSLPSDVPIGAIVVDSKTGAVISSSGNLREADHDPTNHAEIVAIREAAKSIYDWRLNDFIVFTTLEPCIMCAGALIQARVGGLVFGASDPQFGAAGSIYNFFSDPRLMHNPKVVEGILKKECSEILKNFFGSRRKTQTN